MNCKFIHLWLWGALLCGLSLSVTSCKDDDNGTSEEQGGNEEAPQQDEASVRFWSVVGKLVSADDYTADYQDKTFEPTIGSEDTNPQHRVVYTNDAGTAALRFAYLVGETDVVTEQTTTYTWNDPDVGTLTYNKVTDGTAWATVDVSIKQVPHLTRIIYRQPAQDDANGSVGDGGSAYYRFGDVIRITNKDGQSEYWVCVRPAFDPEGKGDSHWVSVSPLPTANQEKYTSSHGKDYVLPTGLDTDEEHMQNLAEMLYAIYAPDQWAKNVEEYSGAGMKIFHDFQAKNIAYHNVKFWKNVAAGWQKYGIAQRVFGLSDDNLKSLVTGSDGLYTLYKGYSWYFTLSNYCTLFQAHYVHGEGNKYANMHTKAPFTKVQKQVVDKKKADGSNDILIDITECTDKKPYYVNEAFFGDANPRFIVRTATGKELSSTGKYDDNQQKIPGCTNIYRYYNDVYPEKDLNLPPEETNTPLEGEAGRYMIGDVVKDNEGNLWFCIAGAPYSKALYPFAKDTTAWFISFCKPNPDVAETRDNFVPEDELAETVMRLLEMYGNLADMQMEEYKLSLKSGTLGRIGQHIYDYAQVDLRELMCRIDSTWTYTDSRNGEKHESLSSSYLFNVAYGSNKDPENSSLARVVFDYTQAGSARGNAVAKSGKNYQNWRFLCYTKYETYDPSRITLTEDEESVGMTKWNALWPMTDDKMMFKDVTNQTMVDKYAKGDKWQKLGKRRSKAGYGRIEDYYWSNHYREFSGHGIGSVFSEDEPVLFFHVMKVTDKGGTYPNLTSQAGTRLSVVHLQNDPVLYRQNFQSVYAGNYSVDSQTLFYLNNQLYKAKQIPGF